MKRLTLLLGLCLGSACSPAPPVSVESESNDAGHAPPAPEADAGQYSPIDEQAQCSTASGARWEQAHRTAQLHDALRLCALEAANVLEEAGYSNCVRERLGVAQCSDCVDRELSCALAACGGECGFDGEPWRCRWCLCRRGCADRFNTCEGGTPIACPSHAPLSPSLIVTVAF